MEKTKMLQMFHKLFQFESRRLQKCCQRTLFKT